MGAVVNTDGASSNEQLGLGNTKVPDLDDSAVPLSDLPLKDKDTAVSDEQTISTIKRPNHYADVITQTYKEILHLKNFKELLISDQLQNMPPLQASERISQISFVEELIQLRLLRLIEPDYIYAVNELLKHEDILPETEQKQLLEIKDFIDSVRKDPPNRDLIDPFPSESNLEIFYNQLEELFFYTSFSDFLSWEQKTRPVVEGPDKRNDQVEVIGKLSHIATTNPRFIKAIEALSAAQLADDDRINVLRTKKDVEGKLKLPVEFVAMRERLAAETNAAWEIASEKNDFAAMIKPLTELISLARKESEYRGYTEHPYDAHLDKYEPGATLKETKQLLLATGEKLAAMLPSIVSRFSSNPPPTSLFPIEIQDKLYAKVVSDMGFDFKRGRMGVTKHPMMFSLGTNDIRITRERNPMNYQIGLTSVDHEAGHGIYEQGFAPDLRFTPLGSAASLGIHESQSRLWENIIGRSKPFAVYLHRTLKDYFPEEHERLTPETLWKELNQVKADFIRIKADEVTYSLHVIIRLALEEDLLTGELEVKDLPGRWNSLYQKYLGITPPTDTLGVLQDVHWYSGGFPGYFPTYTLGNLYAAAMMEKIKVELPNLDDEIANGNFSSLKNWLNLNVHQHGRRYQAGELIQRITGNSLSNEPYLRYIEGKYLS